MAIQRSTAYLTGRDKPQGKLWATPLYHRGVFSFDGTPGAGWVYVRATSYLL